MADTLPNVDLDANTWTDLYAETGISVGTKLTVLNLGPPDVFLKVQAAKPTDLSGYTVISRVSSVPFTNNDGDSGAWAYTANANGKLSVSIST